MSAPKQKIGVVGCGWLGGELALALGAECYSRETTTDESPFWQNKTIIIAINTKDNYLKTVQKIASLTTARIILLSSTSVYREFDGEVDEESIITKPSLQKEVEDALLSLQEQSVIIRLGGLMGDDRIAGRWSNTSSFEDGFVNYIHKADAIGFICAVVSKPELSGIFNAVAPLHPTREQIHRQNSTQFGFELGVFHGFSERIVGSKRVANELGYEFMLPNPLDFWQS